MELTLTLKFKDKEIELTEDEAKQLHSFLGEMFGEKNNTPCFSPIIIREYQDGYFPPYPFPIITCDNTGNKITYKVN
jgi:hypothetical protein